MKNSTKGTLFSLAAFASWGILPLYWKALSSATALEILSHRIVWSLIFVYAVIKFAKKPGFSSVFRDKRKVLTLIWTGILIGINWGVYIWAVISGRTVEASLGYYMNPIFSVFLGFVFLKERLKKVQYLALAFAALGVSYLTIKYGRFPWVSFTLMGSFGFYGLLKKRQNVDSLTALAAETLFLSPFALAFLGALAMNGTGVFIKGGALTSILLAAGGIVTALPLYWFAIGTKSIPLSSVGFCQFVSPSLTLIVGVAVFGEAFGRDRLVSFAFIWSALFLYALSYIDFAGRFGIIKFRSEEGWIEWVRRDFIRALKKSPSDRAFHVALAGGGTPEPIYRSLASCDLDGREVHLWIGDERFLPGDSGERNENMARRAFGIDRKKPKAEPARFILHGWGSKAPAEESAAGFGAELRGALGPRPSFDIAFLGIGEDGHTAGLFPGDPGSGETDALVVRTTAPKEPRTRLSLSLGVLNDSRRARFLVRGTNKAAVVSRAAKRDRGIPAGRITVKDRKILYCLQ